MRLALDNLWRVLHCHLVLQWPDATTAEFWGISVGTVRRLKRQYRLTGTLTRGSPRCRYDRSLLNPADLAYVRALVEQYPDYFLDEFCFCFERDRAKPISKTTMWRAIQRLGFTRKKLNIMAKQASYLKRAEYMLAIAQYSACQFVFMDEVHSDKRTYERRYGWAMAGRRAMKRGIYLRGQKYSSAAAMCVDGLLTYYTIKGGFNAVDFQYFLETFVVPELGVFPAPKSVLVLDNATIHKKEDLANLAALHGFRFVFLPPYSPVLNPIENVFSKFKKYLRRHGQFFLNEGLHDFVILRRAFNSITASDCRGYYRHCGYV